MLTQSEADALFAMPKKPKSGNRLAFPCAGEKLLEEFVSFDGREVFLFNITRASINDLYGIMEDFLKYCNVREMPNIERGLFI